MSKIMKTIIVVGLIAMSAPIYASYYMDLGVKISRAYSECIEGAKTNKIEVGTIDYSGYGILRGKFYKAIHVEICQAIVINDFSKDKEYD